LRATIVGTLDESVRSCNERFGQVPYLIEKHPVRRGSILGEEHDELRSKNLAMARPAS